MGDVSLERKQTALLCLHCQNDLLLEEGKFAPFGFAAMVKKNNVIPKIRRLQDTARQAGLPLFHVRVTARPDYADVPQNCQLYRGSQEFAALQRGSWGAEFVNELQPQGDEVVVEAMRVNAFYGTTLDLHLRRVKAQALLIAGIATNFTVEGTARDAVDRGYDVFIVEDCCASMSQEVHDFTIQRLLPILTTVTNVETVAAALSGR